jgi:hypothetical protein
MIISMDDLLNKSITIREGISMGIISSRVLSDCDVYIRVKYTMRDDNIPKTHAIEKVSEMCRVNESTVWRSYSFTSKLMQVE